MSGWVALYRGWRDNPVFGKSEPMSEREAWTWLIETAAWRPTKRRTAKGEEVAIERGQLHTSLRSLGTVFGWGKNKVDRYLGRLENHAMIGTVSDPNGITITICNYEKYQTPVIGSGTVSGTVAGQSRDTQEQKNNTSPIGEGVPPATAIVKSLFDRGVTILTGSGMREGAARSLIGRLRKSVGDTEVAVLLDQAGSKTDPAAWLVAAVERRGAKPASLVDHILERQRRVA